MTTRPHDDAAAGRYSRPRFDERWARLLWPLAALALLLLFSGVFIPGFFRVEMKDGKLFGTVIDVLDRAAPVLLLAVGMTLVIATGGVDLSVGAVMAIAGATAAVLVGRFGLPAAAGAALLAALAAGAWNGMLVAGMGIQPIVATLILMVAGRGVAQLVTGGQVVTFDDKAFAFLGGGFLFWVPFSLTIVAAVLLGTALLTRKTAIGLFVEAVGGNATASRYAGVNATAVKFLVYVFSGFCAGVAGLVAAADIKAADANNAGLYLELDAILAVVIGGTALAGGRFSLPGSVIGALVIQMLTTMILMLRIDFTFLGRRFGPTGVQPEWTLVVKALIVIIVCLFQSDAVRAALGRALRNRPALRPV